jgi:phosphatidylglycerophosphate synthase
MDEPTPLQALAAKTRGVVTPANILDGAAFLGAVWAGPRFDTWPGVLVAVASYGADAVDGALARATGTASRVGDLVDHVGDKPRVGLALYHIWKRRLADRRLLAAVAAYNALTALITVYDRLSNGSPRVEVTREGKRAMCSTVAGIGLQTVAAQVGRTRPRAGRTIRQVGAVMVCTGLVRYGVPTIRQYWRLATGGSDARLLGTVPAPGGSP